MSEVLPPKRQAAVDRLRRRVEVYTKDHQERFIHYERIGPALCEQQMQESFALKQKYLDPKAKKTSSSKSNKSSGGGGNNNNNSSSGGGASSAERKPATETHAGNTQSVRTPFFFSLSLSLSPIIDPFPLLPSPLSLCPPPAESLIPATTIPYCQRAAEEEISGGSIEFDGLGIA